MAGTRDVGRRISVVLWLEGDLLVENKMKSPSYYKFRTVRDIFPNKCASHRLSKDNTLGGSIPGSSGVIEDGEFWNVIGWTLASGWKLVGWTSPPYLSVGDESDSAIVFEKETPFDADGTYWDKHEPGLYWIHGNPDTLKFFVS